VPNCSPTPIQLPSPLVPLPTCTVSPTPYQDGETPIPHNYQPPDPYTAQLGWLVFTPTPSPAALPPGVIVIHGGGWHYGSASQVEDACADLAAHGYYVVSIAYELARCGYVQGQNSHDHDYDGTLPDDMVTRQTNDIKAFVNALRNDSHVDHNKIGVVGGSAGAAHAIWVALDTTDTGTAWPFWNAAARPQCVVTLSGPFDFSDRTPAPGLALIDSDFILGTENYVNTADLPTLKARSPISLVTAPTPDAPFVPLFMINSWFDNLVSYHQIVDMMCKLESVGVPDSAYQTLTVPGSNDHAFALWRDWDGISDPHKQVRQDVIDFLDAHLK
jgi:acetyl esterase/lipase